MAQETNNTAGTEKNITVGTPIVEEKSMPKRRGRPKKTSQAQPVTTDVTALGEAEPTPASEVTVDTPATELVLSDTPSKRHYPTISERLAAVDANIARLTQINESRATLLAKTQTTLDDRKAALEKSMKALADAQAKKAMLAELQNRPSKPPVAKTPKLSPEERQQARISALEHARAARKAKKDARVAEEAKIRELSEKLKASGRSVDELLENLAAREE